MKNWKRLVCVLFIFSFIFLTNNSVVEAASHSQAEAVAWAKAQLGKGLDYDGVYGNQCVDLIKYYYAYFGVAGYAKGNGSDYQSNALPPGWNRVYSNYQPGDVAVWKPSFQYGDYSTGSAGHVGIITAVNGSRITVVNQNFANQAYCTSNSFPTAVIACAIRPAYSGGAATITTSWSEWEENVTEHNAMLYAQINVSQKTQFNQAGILIWDESGTLIHQSTESTSINYTYMQIHYDVQNELHLTLAPGKNYTYQMFADFGGNRYYSNKKTFRTKGSSVIKGDVNRDGKVDLSDAIALLNKITAQEEVDTVTGDVNQDGKVDLQDAIGLLNLITQK